MSLFKMSADIQTADMLHLPVPELVGGKPTNVVLPVSYTHLYHTTYLNQLLIHAQRPDATACATMKYWNEQAHRKVMYGSKGTVSYTHLDVYKRQTVRALTDMFTILWQWIVSGKKRKNVRRSWMSSITMRTTSIRTTLILMTLVQTTLVRMILAVTTSDSKCHR